MVDISFVILTWNSETYIRRCLDSLTQACHNEGIAFEVVAVDNGSTDGSVTVLKKYQAAEPDTFHLVQFDTNKGTTFPRNVGIRESQGRHICILDSDTEFFEGCVRDVLNYLQADRSVGIIAPRLMLPDETIQPSVKRFPAFWHKLLKMPKVLFGIKCVDADFYEEFPFKETTAVDTAISACWLFRRDLLDSVGFLDENIFYSPEDLDYCMRVAKIKRLVLYWPAMTLIHHTQQISHKKPFSKTAVNHFLGLIYYYRKHGGWLQAPSFQRA